MPLAEAREMAAEWRRTIGMGVDPRQAKRDRDAAAGRARTLKEATFAKLAEDYMRAELPRQRKGAVAERVILHELIGIWRDRPAAGVGQEDIEQFD